LEISLFCSLGLSAYGEPIAIGSGDEFLSDDRCGVDEHGNERAGANGEATESDAEQNAFSVYTMHRS
jgi:hypothetical protein